LVITSAAALSSVAVASGVWGVGVEVNVGFGVKVGESVTPVGVEVFVNKTIGEGEVFTSCGAGCWVTLVELGVGELQA
jgi:hypothetical protein